MTTATPEWPPSAASFLAHVEAERLMLSISRTLDKHPSHKDHDLAIHIADLLVAVAHAMVTDSPNVLDVKRAIDGLRHRCGVHLEAAITVIASIYVCNEFNASDVLNDIPKIIEAFLGE